MKFAKRLGWVVVCTAMVGAPLLGQQGYWRAASKAASSITGDVQISSVKISIDFYTTALADIRDLSPEEVSSVFDTEAGSAGAGKLYRVSIPAGKTFLHKNKLCGDQDTQWVVTTVTGKTLQMALFSGTGMPVLTREAVANSTNLCGTFTYVR